MVKSFATVRQGVAGSVCRGSQLRHQGQCNDVRGRERRSEGGQQDVTGDVGIEVGELGRPAGREDAERDRECRGVTAGVRDLEATQL